MLLGKLALHTNHDHLRVPLTEQCLEEAKHAWMLTETIQKLGAVPLKITQTYQSELGKIYGFPDGTVDILCLTRVLEVVALETYQNEYGVGYPQEERPAGRPAKTSLLYDRLRAIGAVFGARGGWERAVYYTRPDDPAGTECSFRRPHWHRAVARECAAVANGVAALDLPGFA